MGPPSLTLTVFTSKVGKYKGFQPVKLVRHVRCAALLWFLEFPFSCLSPEVNFDCMGILVTYHCNVTSTCFIPIIPSSMLPEPHPEGSNILLWMYHVEIYCSDYTAKSVHLINQRTLWLESDMLNVVSHPDSGFKSLVVGMLRTFIRLNMSMCQSPLCRQLLSDVCRSDICRSLSHHLWWPKHNWLLIWQCYYFSGNSATIAVLCTWSSTYTRGCLIYYAYRTIDLSSPIAPDATCSGSIKRDPTMFRHLQLTYLDHYQCYQLKRNQWIRF